MRLNALMMLGLLVSGCATAPVAQVPTVDTTAARKAQLDALADRYVSLQLRYNPPLAYFIGVPAPDHRRWADFRPEAFAAYRREMDELAAELRHIHPAGLPAASQNIHAAMLDRLEADQAGRVCRSELWDVDHMGGWHMALSRVAQEQPVSTAEERVQALERWAALPQFIEQQIANARTGLASGFSSPKPVVRKVIKQLEGLIEVEPEKSPLYSPAERSTDAEFKRQFREVLSGSVRTAFVGYRDFLVREYLPRARDALAITANPDGLACYKAALRSTTTLDRSPEEVYRLGQQTVAANKARVIELGRGKFGTTDLPQIVERIKAAPDNRFGSEQELIDFSRAVVARAREKSAVLFLELPRQQMLIEPFHAFQRGTGGSSHYESNVDPDKPAYYRINSEIWADEARGGAEITAVHEGFPGHHMQIAMANALDTPPIVKLTGNSAYVEGWARYAEMLAEEAGIYQTDYALMTRRLWPARGMVVDPGLHVMGWTREQAVAFMRESGRFTQQEAEDAVDRIAVWPGQLTAYDSGALEIMALRRQAEEALGDRFDIREFHQRVLENGSVPLGRLRANVEAWIDAKRDGG